MSFQLTKLGKKKKKEKQNKPKMSKRKEITEMRNQ